MAEIHSTVVYCTVLQYSEVIWTPLTHEAATSQMQLVPSRGDPDSTGIGADQTRLALRVLRKESHNPLHWRPCHRGNTLSGLQQSLKQTSLIEDHVV